MSEQEQFRDIAYCRSQILEVRRYITDKSKVSEHVFNVAFHVLTMMLFHCPEEFVETVRAHIDETNTKTYTQNPAGMTHADSVCFVTWRANQ